MQETTVNSGIEKVSSSFAGPAAQRVSLLIQIIRPPAAAVAEEQSLPEASLTDRNWPRARVEDHAGKRSNGITARPPTEIP